MKLVKKLFPFFIGFVVLISIPFLLHVYSLSRWGWITYTNKTFGYSLMYPPDWKIDTSKAEPTFDMKHPTQPCPFLNELKITPPNNLGFLRIQYGSDCLGGQPVSSSFFLNTIIDHQDAKKIYVNTCDSYAPALTPTSCTNQIRYIIFAGPQCDIENSIPKTNKIITCGQVSNYLNIRSQLVRISFGVSNFNEGIPLNKATFLELNKQIDTIVSSFTVSKNPPHPEVN